MFQTTSTGHKPKRSRKLVTSDRALFNLLVRHAKERAPEVAYPKSVADFARFIVRQIPEGLDLRLGKFNDIGPSLLVDALRSTTKQKKGLFSPVLVEFAARIYEQPKEEIRPEDANPILIKALQLHHHFQVRQIGGSWFLTCSAEFTDQFGVDVLIPQQMAGEDVPAEGCTTLTLLPGWTSPHFRQPRPLRRPRLETVDEATGPTVRKAQSARR